jgi:hypothetical protein
MNLKMQEFFRHWHEIEKTDHADAAFVDQNEIEVMTRMNRELKEKLNDADLRKRFFGNVQICQDLMNEITQRVAKYQPELKTGLPDTMSSEPPEENHLCGIFSALKI